MNNLYTIFIVVFCTIQIYPHEATDITEITEEMKKSSYDEQQFQNYTQQLLGYSMSINETWNKTKDLIQNLIGDNQLPIADIFQSARKTIKMKTVLLSKDIAENCIQETENKFIILYRQVAASLLNCASSKSRKALIALLKAQDDLEAGLRRATAIQDKLASCGNRNNAAEEREACVQPLLIAAEMEEMAGKDIFIQANAALHAGQGVPPGLMQCSEHIYQYIRGKVQTIVDTVDSCAKSANK